jgi:hypothetical protein
MSRPRVSFASQVETIEHDSVFPWRMSNSTLPRRSSLKKARVPTLVPIRREPASVHLVFTIPLRHSHSVCRLPQVERETSIVSSSAPPPEISSDLKQPFADPLDCLSRTAMEEFVRPRGPTWNKFLNRETTPSDEEGDELLLIARPNVVFLSEKEFDIWAAARATRPKSDRFVHVLCPYYMFIHPFLSSPVCVYVPEEYEEGILYNE